MKIELEYIEKLVKLVNENELTEISVEEGEKAVIVRKERTITTVQAAPIANAVVPAQSQQVLSTPQYSAETTSEEIMPVKKGLQIISPMVGTFYGASSPGAEPFMTVGKTVSSGQVVCIIEAMKLMNEIESEVTGKIVEILVQDGQPVEYGQVLMIVEPS